MCPHCGYTLSNLPEILSPGTLLQGRYEIQEPPHTGETSYIYIAKDKKLYDRRCIIKQIKEPIKTNAEIERLKQVILGMAGLTIPNVAMVLDHFVEGEYYFLIVEYIAGKNLSEVYQENQGQLAEEEIIRWAISMCDIANSIHKQGITHGEIGARTVMLTEEGFIKFVDLGIFRQLYDITKGDKSNVLQLGTTSQEQKPEKPDPQSDIYAIGVTIYYLLTGYMLALEDYPEHPESPKRISGIQFPPVREKNPHVSQELEAVLQKALHMDTNRRYSSATELSLDLKNLIRKAPILTVDCEALEFSDIMPGRSETRMFTITNDGSSRLVGKLSSDRPWLELSQINIDLETGYQEILATVNARGLPNGFSGTSAIDIITNGGKKSISVSLSVKQTAIGSVLVWVGDRKWLVFLIIIIIIVASSGMVIKNTIFKETSTAPTSATILFEDEFSNSGSGWYTGSDQLGEGKYENGEYLLVISRGNYDIVVRTNDKISPLSDFALEVDARLSKGPDNTWYGIGFRQQDKDNSYDFLIRSGDATKNASYAIFKQVNGTWSTLKDWTDSSHINGAAADNHLKIICKGDEIEVYANAYKLTKIKDSSFAKGKIVFEAAKDQGAQANIHFDNLKIYVPP